MKFVYIYLQFILYKLYTKLAPVCFKFSNLFFGSFIYCMKWKFLETIKKSNFILKML